MHSAYLKIERAKEHITDLTKVIEETPPFTYVYKVNAVTRYRTVGPKHNKPVIDRLGLLAGDAVHNLRTAFDQVMWSILEPFAKTDDERRKIVFPFRLSKERFDTAFDKGIISHTPPEVRAVIQHYRPYQGGHELLYALHDLDIIDKHRLLVPTADYTLVQTDVLKRQIPDFPLALGGMIGGSNNGAADIAWRGPAIPGVPFGAFEKELDVPVQIVFAWGAPYDFKPMVPTLHRIVDLTKEVVGKLLDAWGGAV